MSCASAASHLACNQCDVRSVSQWLSIALAAQDESLQPGRVSICSYVCVFVCVCACVWILARVWWCQEGKRWRIITLYIVFISLSILSFILKFLYFQFLPFFVIVQTLLPVFKIAIFSCDTSGILLSNIMTVNLTFDAI